MVDRDYNIDINNEDKFEINIEDTTYTLEINPTDTFEIQLNEQGPQGDRGYTGNGIVKTEKTATIGNVDTYTITYTNGNTDTFTVTNAPSTFVFEQGIASDTWVIEHNLNKRPSVTVVDTAGTVFTASVEYNNDNVCTVYINGATKGIAYLN